MSVFKKNITLYLSFLLIFLLLFTTFYFSKTFVALNNFPQNPFISQNFSVNQSSVSVSEKIFNSRWSTKTFDEIPFQIDIPEEVGAKLNFSFKSGDHNNDRYTIEISDKDKLFITQISFNFLSPAEEEIKNYGSQGFMKRMSFNFDERGYLRKDDIQKIGILDNKDIYRNTQAFICDLKSSCEKTRIIYNYIELVGETKYSSQLSAFVQNEYSNITMTVISNTNVSQTDLDWILKINDKIILSLQKVS